MPFELGETGMDYGGYQRNRRRDWEADRLTRARDECNAMSYATLTDEVRGEGERR